MYRVVDAGMLRAAAASGGTQSWPTVAERSQDAAPANWRNWLRQEWRPDLAEAVEVASADLAAAVEGALSGRITSPQRVRRTVEAVRNYRLRSAGRATPFGMFAGIAPMRLERHTQVVWGGRHRAAAAPDPRWLAEIEAVLLRQPASLARTSVAVNDLVVERNGWIELPGGGGAAALGSDRWQCRRIRLTDPVRRVLEAASPPITVAVLLGQLGAQFRTVPGGVLARLVTDLIDQGVLLTDLETPMHVTDVLAHLRAHPATAAANEKVEGELEELASMMADYPSAATPSARRALRERAAIRMGALGPPARPLAVDVHLDAAVSLPPSVRAEAAIAAEALVRLSARPHGRPEWRAWHRAFLERYSSGALVPVIEAVDSAIGVGYPAGYRGAARPAPPPLGERDHLLLRWAQSAVLEGRELTLADRDIEQLAAAAGAARGPVAPHTELRFAVAAATPQAVDRGAFLLLLAGVSRAAGTTLGRFLSLLDPAARQSAVDALSGLPPMTEGAVIAQLSCPPLAPRVRHLGRSVEVFPPLPVGEHPAAGGGFRLRDLAVTATADQLWLVDLSTGRTVEPLMLNAIEHRLSVHPMARFLCELPTALAARPLPFQWGAAEQLSVLPRVRYRRTVLAPARWMMAAGELPERHVSFADWSAGFAALRRARRIPRWVHLGPDDTLIRLDLDEPAHRAVLRTHLDRHNAAVLHEAPDADAFGWIGGRVHEIVLPLASTAPPQPSPPHLRAGSQQSALRPVHLPGTSPWLCAQLRAHPDQHTAILMRLPKLWECWPGGPPAAWFLRYCHPGPHLRLRIPLPEPDDFGPAARRLALWAEQLREAGLLASLSLASYAPETGRYGQGAALAAAEHAFAADSAAALVQLASCASAHGPDRTALAAASLLNLAAAFTGSPTTARAWMLKQPARPPAPAPTARVRGEALRLADASTGATGLAGLPSGAELADSWKQRATAIAAYRRALPADGPNPDLVLSSLMHLHHARMIGLDPDSERTVRHLARAAALSHTVRARARDGH
ncbi:hypothetical protein BIV57_11270 [Mangrovactinospora gilvigrisea]|uniref:Lantibiotic dehydratase n=1 Tax=Mangrovactinospora gilvigrisea TaxID=1428644 RepID=A0A1J7BV93_9ACTN|nr:hypothetical protein BIV57_11270 [Mangrovactinospora gilvigrisea]